jgi:hypothetical protein
VERVHDSDSGERANRVTGQPDLQAHCSTFNVAARSLNVIDEVDPFIVLVLRAKIEDCGARPEVVYACNLNAGVYGGGELTRARRRPKEVAVACRYDVAHSEFWRACVVANHTTTAFPPTRTMSGLSSIARSTALM